MPGKKDDPAASTHFAANHQVGGFKKGQIFSAAELRRTFGRDKDATPEEHEEYQAAQLRRLLDLGAIGPAEAPEEEVAPAPAGPTQAERDRADAEAAGKKPEAAHPAPTPPQKK